MKSRSITLGMRKKEEIQRQSASSNHSPRRRKTGPADLLWHPVMCSLGQLLFVGWFSVAVIRCDN